ncbi:malate dehydrogenase [Vibrio sp. 99K-1]|uniref:lactate/malate family dehydrogenase n=1 Tax=Vibrio sp. 99K-1 TaxID=2607603 RepID=UPI001493B379|nr:malate dehydrogenase [Vibrio sp. 99K-1]NOI88737.1 malate dehydrogenase [Vibrio sp. 99K-1]
MKIIFLGFGGIGQEALNALLNVSELRNNVNEIVIFCRNVEKSQAIYEDILDGLLVRHIFENHTKVRLPKTFITDNYCHLDGADVILCCYGVPSTFPMSDRQTLLEEHVHLSAKIFNQIKPLITPGCHIINAVNPVDSISYYIEKVLLDSNCKVIGIGAIHNTARLLKNICRVSKLDPQCINTSSLQVCGEHGNGLVPLLSLVKTNKGPLNQLLSAQELEEVINDTCNQGLSIYHKMKRPPKYGPTASILIVLMRLVQKDKAPFCGSIWLPKLGVFMSWPLILKNGVFEPLSVSTSQYEQQQINLSANKLRQIIKGFH